VVTRPVRLTGEGPAARVSLRRVGAGIHGGLLYAIACFQMNSKRAQQAGGWRCQRGFFGTARLERIAESFGVACVRRSQSGIL